MKETTAAPAETQGSAMGLAFNERRYGEAAGHLDLEGDDRLRVLFRVLDGQSGKKIMDVGCAEGSLSATFRERGLYSIGVDASAYAVETIRPQYDEAHLVDLSHDPIPLPDDSVDFIWAGEVIEHIFDTEFFAEEMLRVLKPGGRLVLSTPNLACWLNRIVLLAGLQPFFTEIGVRATNTGNFLRAVALPAGHIRMFTRSSLRHFLRERGWEVESIHGVAVLTRPSVRWLDRIISRSFSSLATDLVFVCRKPARPQSRPSV